MKCLVLLVNSAPINMPVFIIVKLTLKQTTTNSLSLSNIKSYLNYA